MARFVKGEVVVVPFPFSKLTQAKRRPALVAAVLPGDDLILCQITSQSTRDQFALPIGDADFSRAGLRKPSHVRPNHLFTADSALILYGVGRLKDERVQQVIDTIVQIFQQN